MGPHQKLLKYKNALTEKPGQLLISWNARAHFFLKKNNLDVFQNFKRYFYNNFTHINFLILKSSYYFDIQDADTRAYLLFDLIAFIFIFLFLCPLNKYTIYVRTPCELLKQVASGQPQYTSMETSSTDQINLSRQLFNAANGVRVLDNGHTRYISPYKRFDQR